MTIGILLSLFFLTRLYRISTFPLFLDETIYIRWLSTIQSTNDWLLPLKEFGWEPLNIWIAHLFNFIIKDSLLSLRLTAVFFGLLTLIFLFLFLRQFFKSQKILTILLPFIFSPLILLHDRLGLRGDSAVSFALILTLYGISLRFFKKNENASYLIALGIIIGLMIKTSAVILPVITFILYLIFRPKLKKHDFFSLALIFTPFIFFYLTSTLDLVIAKSSVFANTTNIFIQAKNNFLQIIPWIYHYLTWPLVFTFIIGLFAGYKNHKKPFILLGVSLVAYLAFIILTAKMLFPRYILLSFIPILIFSGIGLEKLNSLLPKILKPLLLVFLIPGIIISHQSITNINKANLPEIDRWQYVTGWPAGSILPDLINYLKSNTPDTLITENNDLIRSAVPYLWPDHTLNIVHMNDELYLPELELSNQTVFLALNILEKLPDQFEAELIKEISRPDNKSSIRLYKVTNIK